MEETQDPLSLDSLISEIEARLGLFEQNLPRQIDPVGLSRSKLPFKALSYRETLIWRVTELARVALDALHAGRLAVSVVLARAVVETTAALWYLSNKLERTLDTGTLGDIDGFLMSLSMGTRTWTDEGLPQAINVLTFIRWAEKTLPGIEHGYAVLSEYAHPNYAGTTGLFSYNDHQRILTDFGPNPRMLTNTKSMCAANLSAALLVFEGAYEKVGDMIPRFVALCEKDLDNET
jgi:hypothetical protein